MVEISPEVAINALMQQGAMVKIDGNVLFESSKTHCIILLNSKPSADDYYIFACVTSQYDKRIHEAEIRGLSPKTIVMIRPREYIHLPKYTAIDCNYLHAVTKAEFVALYRSNRVTFYRANPRMNEAHKNAIIEGALLSPLVINEYKNMIKGS